MPSVGRKQQALMAIALHDPSKLKGGKNKGVLKMSKTQLRDFASTSTKGLPRKKKAKKVQTMEQYVAARNRRKRKQLG